MRDNVTGFIWEVKTNDGGLHHWDNSYSWYDTNPSSNGGFSGFPNETSTTCWGYNAANSATWCNTQAYVARVNAAGWCGARNWRLPTLDELRSIVDYGGYNPAIDARYFPYTNKILAYWSASPDAYLYRWAWYVDFYYGDAGPTYEASSLRVRLVRDGQVTLTVAATDNSATEAGLATGTYTFTRTGSTATALTVNYTVSGTATAGTDYVGLGTSITIPIGKTTITKTVTPLQDTLQELNETVVLSLKQSANYAVGNPANATVTVTSDEPVTKTVTLSATDASATEAGLTTGTYTFTRTGSTATAFTVNYTVSGTATAGTDYVGLGTSITIPIGKTTITKTVTPLQDTLQELNETVVLSLKQSANYAVGNPASATVMIASDE